MRMQRFMHPVLILLAILCWPCLIVAQQTTMITGQVTDQTGAVIPKALVIAHNDLTNQEVATESTSTGSFTITNLRPGNYQVSAGAQGFATSVEKGIRLELDASVTVRLVLKPGAATESLVVHADEVQLDLTHAQRGEVFSQDELENAPLDSGNPLLMANVQPGVTFTGNRNSWSNTWVRPFDNSAINQFSTNGQGSDSNDFQLDGSPNNANSFGSRDIGYVPPAASIQEMKVITNPYDAQYGHTGGAVFDMVTKYGTNKLHGQIYENYRRSWLNANSHYNNALGYGKGKEWIDQYGGEVDGPLALPFKVPFKLPGYLGAAGKTFFAAQYEGYREGSPLTFLDSVPPLDPDDTSSTVIETGNFSEDYWWSGSAKVPVTIYNPLTSGLDSDDTVNRDAFSGNLIPTASINKTAQKILSYLPKPNYTTPSDQSWGVSNHTAQNNSSDQFKSVVLRLDHNFGENDRAYLRYAWNKRFESRPFTGISGDAKMGTFPLVRQNHFFTGDWIHTITPNSVFDTHFSYTRYSYAQKQGVTPYDLSKLGWSSSYNTTMPMPAFPQISMSGYTGMGDDFTNGGNKISVTNTIAAMPILTYNHGAHSMKLGVDFRWMTASNYTGGASSPYLYVDTQWTRKRWSTWEANYEGNSWASMMLGTMTSGYVDNNAKLYYIYPYSAPFFQDDWKVTPRLTLNLGIRWDLEVPSKEIHNRANGALDTTTVNPVMDQLSTLPAGTVLLGGLTYAGVNGKPRSLYNMDWLALQPRLGFAYLLRDKTVLKGGIGTTYQSNPAQGYNYGFSQQTSYVASSDGGMSPSVNLDDPFPTVATAKGSSLGLLNNLGDSISVINTNFRKPGTLNYSLSIQQQIDAHTTVDLGFVGSRGFNLDTSDNINNISASFKSSCDLQQQATVTRYKECITSASNGAHVANPFKGVDGFSTVNTGNGNGYYTNNYLSSGIYSRRFPQFGDITMTELNDGSTVYNSGQLAVTYRWSNALNLHGSIVWSKTMESGGYKDTSYRIRKHILSEGDRPWRYTFNSTWHIPVGHGRRLLGNSNKIVDEALGNWVLSPIYTYEIGTPWMVPGGVQMLRKQNYGVHRVTEGGVKLIRGANNCIAWYNPSDNYNLEVYGEGSFQMSRSDCSVDNADWLIRPSYSATKNYSFSGSRKPNFQQFDLSLGKVFPLWKGIGADLRINAFNVLNHPTWDEGYWDDPTDTHFGTLNMTYSSQTNQPRQVQISGKITW